MDTRRIAVVALEIFAWLSLVGGVIGFVVLLFYEPEVPYIGLEATVAARAAAKQEASILMWCSLAGGLVWWALLLTIVRVADQVHELHHEIKRAMQ